MAQQLSEVTSRQADLPRRHRSILDTTPTLAALLPAADIERAARRFIANHPTVVTVLELDNNVPERSRAAVRMLVGDCIEQIKGAQALAGLLLHQLGRQGERITVVNAEAEVRIHQLLAALERFGGLPAQEG